MLIFLIQWGGARYHPGATNLFQPLMLLLVAVGSGAVVLSVLGLVVPRSRRGLRDWRSRRRSAQTAANAERRARAIMTELCPFGWQAQITLFDTATGAASDRVGEGAPLGPVDLGRPSAGHLPRDAVALDWAELSPSPFARPAVMRRVWAPTIAEALQAMVADRQTDETLEQIEQLAAADGVLWPDLESGSA